MAKPRITAYVEDELITAAVKFMARNEKNIKRYRRGKMSLLMADALAKFIGWKQGDAK